MNCANNFLRQIQKTHDSCLRVINVISKYQVGNRFQAKHLLVDFVRLKSFLLQISIEKTNNIGFNVTRACCLPQSIKSAIVSNKHISFLSCKVQLVEFCLIEVVSWYISYQQKIRQTISLAKMGNKNVTNA